MQSLNLLGMDLASFLKSDGSRFETHILLRAECSMGRDVMVWSDLNLRFMMLQRFSIRLRSGELPGQSITVKSWEARRTVTRYALWQGAPSCKN